MIKKDLMLNELYLDDDQCPFARKQIPSRAKLTAGSPVLLSTIDLIVI
jgi:hypothetical protein